MISSTLLLAICFSILMSSHYFLLKWLRLIYIIIIVQSLVFFLIFRLYGFDVREIVLIHLRYVSGQFPKKTILFRGPIDSVGFVVKIRYSSPWYLFLLSETAVIDEVPRFSKIVISSSILREPPTKNTSTSSSLRYMIFEWSYITATATASSITFELVEVFLWLSF